MTRTARTLTGERRRPSGTITRGTTAPNRLRRVDAWTVHTFGRVLAGSSSPPLAVDLGFGASPVTTVEMFDRLGKARADVEVLGVEIDPARVEQAATFAREGVQFALGGFELGPVRDHGLRPVVVRAFNVLRQYDASAVADAWAEMAASLIDGGGLIEGTCDELGRRATWLRIGTDGQPQSLTFAARLAGLDRPSDLAERLPKALIHRNVPGEPIGDFFTAWDRAWVHAAGTGVFGARQRWMAVAAALREQGWPILDGPSRWRLGELTVAWAAVGGR